MSSFSFEGLPGINSIPEYLYDTYAPDSEDSYEDRYELPDDLRSELINPPEPASDRGNPHAGRVRPVSSETLKDVISTQGLADMDGLGQTPEAVARLIYRGLFYETRVKRKPRGSSHDAAMHMLAQERGKLPSDEF